MVGNGCLWWVEMDVRSVFFEFVGGLDFVELGAFGYEFFLQPGEVFGQRGSVSDVALSHAFELGVVLDGFGIADWTSYLFDLFVAPKSETQRP